MASRINTLLSLPMLTSMAMYETLFGRLRLGGTTADDLDDLIRRVDPDRWLTSRFIGDAAARGDVIALYAYDHELARARRVASTPLMAEIRLTWWREALDEIFEGGPVRRHPTAEALAAAVRRRGLPRAPLEAMIDGQIAALEQAALGCGGRRRLGRRGRGLGRRGRRDDPG